MSSGNVYVTYENSVRGNVTGIYANRKLAKKERDKRGDLKIIDEFPIKGYRGDDWETTIPDYCKYYTPHLETIRELINCLYQLEGCCCGGLAHIVTDDENIEDHHIQFVLDECDKEENQDREEVGLVKLICTELLKLSIQQRALLMSSYYAYGFCIDSCEKCPITKGRCSYDDFH